MLFFTVTLEAGITDHVGFWCGKIPNFEREGSDRICFTSDLNYFTEKFMPENSIGFLFVGDTAYNLVSESGTVLNTSVSSADTCVVHLHNNSTCIGRVFNLV